MVDLAKYMAENIRSTMASAYRNALGNPREARFVLNMQQSFRRSERKRNSILKQDNLAVPPFLIASIATTCNLHCKGCYARQNGIAADAGEAHKATLSAAQWKNIFDEAAKLGVNFVLLAGGEPLTQREILEQAASVKEMIFPIFTNGTLIAAKSAGPGHTPYIDFFKKHLNLIPIISIEGDASRTDDRRGAGVYRLVHNAMEQLAEEKLFFGTSITVTTENVDEVTSIDYMKRLQGMGCKIIFYVEYVPIDPGTEHLALSEEQSAELLKLLDQRREALNGVIIFSFPGDEQSLDGCLAAGRGFFHIGPDGAAEPCPFSPYSDSNVTEIGLRAALASPLFRRIRTANLIDWHHTGGCTLYEHRDEVEQICNENKQ